VISRGKKPEAHGTAPAVTISGHIDDWQETAVDYVDGTLEPATKTLVEQHLAGCPECAARIRSQRTMSTVLSAAAMEQPPAYLEDEVLGEILFPRAAERPVPIRAAKERSRRPAAWRRRVMLWIPAAAAVVVVLVAMVVYGMVRPGAEPADEQVATTTAAAEKAMGSASEEVATLEATDNASADAYPSTTVASATTMAPTASAPVAAEAPGATTDGTGTKYLGPVVQDRDGMIEALDARIGVPSCWFFEAAPAQDGQGTTPSPDTPPTTVPSPFTGNGETIISTEQALQVAAQITALTGLEPFTPALDFGGPAFAAYVPLSDTAQFVDLLVDIHDSTGLSLSLITEPGEAVNQWLALVLEHEAELVELSAQRTPAPSVSTWSFTTSTLERVDGDGSNEAGNGEDASTDSTSSTETTEPLPVPSRAGTHVLVLILMNTVQ